MIVSEKVGDVTLPTAGVIAHGVNCQGVMASGVAAVIRKKFPAAYEHYLELASRTEPKELLGHCQLIKVAPGLYVANLFTQLNYGRTGEQFVSYPALRLAFTKLHLRLTEIEQEREHLGVHTIHSPLIGCGLGGGKWELVRPIIDDTTEQRPVIIYRN